eukprot:6195108-Pleurochrysis_carterae.AAC.1
MAGESGAYRASIALAVSTRGFRARPLQKGEKRNSFASSGKARALSRARIRAPCPRPWALRAKALN